MSVNVTIQPEAAFALLRDHQFAEEQGPMVRRLAESVVTRRPIEFETDEDSDLVETAYEIADSVNDTFGEGSE